MPYPDVDAMQVCENGHIMTTWAIRDSNSRSPRSSKCGAVTMYKCPTCDELIPGDRIARDGEGYVSPRSPPAYCGKCGSAFPWTTAPAPIEPPHGSSAPSSDADVLKYDDIHIDDGDAAGEGAKLMLIERRSKPSTNKVFVVHGHDNAMKLDVARTLEKLDLKPIILHEQPNRGRTIIEKLADHSDVDFAVVLLSPDDRGFSKAKGPKTAKDRARQNVLVELGDFVGKLERSSVCALVKGDVEVPSDFDGVVYTKFEGDWKSELVKELRAAGYSVDANRL